MIGFIYSKLLILNRRDDIDILTMKREAWFEDTDRFSSKDDHFFVAAGITEYDSNPESIEDERYGRLVLEHYGWGNDDGIGLNVDSTIKQHNCTDEELGFVQGPTTRLYPIVERSFNEVKTFKKKF